MNRPEHISFPPDTVRAHVIAGDVETCYRRAGRGPAIVVLTADAAVSAQLLSVVPRHCQAIAPEWTTAPPLDGGAFMIWLRGFLDALGLATVSLVVDPAFGPQASVFALHEPDRVRRVVVLDLEAGNPFEGMGDL
jgi:hypothetical protein